MPASLYVVATPIGNLDDITLRALNILKAVSLIAAEDTRRTGTLLRHFGIATPTTSFHEHNERHKLPQLLQKLADGQDVALVSDAGTPVVADPGQRLIAAAIDRGVTVVPIPGASAVMAALVVSGFPADSFLFGGFAPAKSNDRNKWLSALNSEPRVIVFFEAPHRIRKTLAAVGLLLVNRPIIICRELTKLHEEVIRVASEGAGDVQVTEKGEFSIVVGPMAPVSSARQIAEDKDIYEIFYQMTNSEGLGRRVALAKTADRFGLSTNEAYSAVERFKKSAAS
jgi:16S rRNA (cytidine1402-2'-O)-methyltransferase